VATQWKLLTEDYVMSVAHYHELCIYALISNEINRWNVKHCYLFTRSWSFWVDSGGSLPPLKETTASRLNTLITRSWELTRKELTKKKKKKIKQRSLIK